MKVYIASRYIANQKINHEIFEELKSVNVNAFLPKSINVDAISKEEMCYVAETCYDELDVCDVILAVFPFRESVSAEIGYVINEKRKKHNKTIILYVIDTEGYEKITKEAMIYPYFDYEFFSDSCVNSQAAMSGLDIKGLADFIKSLDK